MTEERGMGGREMGGMDVDGREMEGMDVDGREMEGKGEGRVTGTVNFALAKFTLIGVMTGDLGDTCSRNAGTSSGDDTMIGLGEVCL